MTENPVTSASYATEIIFPLPALVLLSVALTLLVVVAYGLADFCWSCLENQVDILLDQDRRLHDVERGQAPAKEGAATVIILRLPVFQIDETTEFFSNGCAICLEDFQKGVDCCVLSPCKHVFHSSCLKQWLEVNLTCPLCRNFTFDDMFLC